MNVPAIIGGEPAFREPVPIMRPTLPSLEEMSGQFADILGSGMLSNVNRYVAQFESAAAEYLGVKHAIAVSSCTSGLILAMKAMELTGEVILPSFTFSATGHSLVWNNLEPVFADCDRATHQLDPSAVESLVTERTSAIVGVHIFGSPCDSEALARLARERGLRMIFDAAHAFGAAIGARPVGGFGDAEVFSLSPTKVLVSGEGGMVATDDDELARRVRIGRDYGNPGNYNCEFAGLNARMSELHAALGLHSLARLDANVGARNRLAARYKEQLSEINGIGFQEHLPNTRSTFKDFSLVVDEERMGIGRDILAKALSAEGIGSRPYFDPPLHKQTAYSAQFADADGRLVNTNWLAARALSIPLFAHMDDAALDKICDAVARIVSNSEAVTAAVRQ